MKTKDRESSEETLEILVGITPERYAQYKGRNINVYEMVGVSSSGSRDREPADAEEAILTDAEEKGCEVVLNVIPKVIYNESSCNMEVYLVGLGLRLRQNEP